MSHFIICSGFGNIFGIPKGQASTQLEQASASKPYTWHARAQLSRKSPSSMRAAILYDGRRRGLRAPVYRKARRPGALSRTAPPQSCRTRATRRSAPELCIARLQRGVTYVTASQQSPRLVSKHEHDDRRLKLMELIGL